MTRLSILEIVGPYCGTHSDGDKVFSAILPFLRKGEKVSLDFDHIELTSSSFFNALFWRISEEFNDDFIDRNLSYVSLKPRHQFVLDRTRSSTPV